MEYEKLNENPDYTSLNWIVRPKESKVIIAAFRFEMDAEKFKDDDQYPDTLEILEI